MKADELLEPARREAQAQFGPATSWDVLDVHISTVPEDGYCCVTAAVQLDQADLLYVIVRFAAERPDDCYIDEFYLSPKEEALRLVAWSRANEP